MYLCRLPKQPQSSRQRPPYSNDEMPRPLTYKTNTDQLLVEGTEVTWQHNLVIWREPSISLGNEVYNFFTWTSGQDVSVLSEEISNLSRHLACTNLSNEKDSIFILWGRFWKMYALLFLFWWKWNKHVILKIKIFNIWLKLIDFFWVNAWIVKL